MRLKCSDLKAKIGTTNNIVYARLKVIFVVKAQCCLMTAMFYKLDV